MASPLLVLSQYVYAKKQDGGFYSGRIEGKQSENTYNIVFSDHTSSAVDEKDLVWLGFYSLPPHIWPKSPNIHPMNSPVDDDGRFYNAQIKREVEDFGTRRPESLRLLKNPKEWVRKEQQNLNKEGYICSNEHCQCNDAKIRNLESVSNREDETRTGQVRSSVLRLNRKALSAEISQKQNERETCSPSSLSSDSPPGNEWTRYEEMRERYLSNASRGSTSPHSSAYICHDPPYYSPPCLTPPSTPSNLPPPLFICSPYDTAVFGEVDTREWKQMDRRNIGGGKRRRRDNMKKCRKVYGIDNRDLWCTQCKWKKACTRFQIGNYGQRHF